MNDWNWPPIAWTAAGAGCACYLAALLLLAHGGAAAGGPVVARAATHPGLWAVAWLVEGLAFLSWCLLPLAGWARFRAEVPTRSLIAALIGGAGFFTLAQLALARSGGLAFLATLSSSHSSLRQGLAAELGQWQQLWLFGGSWEAMADTLAFGLWFIFLGRIIAGVLRDWAGHLLSLVGVVASFSLVAGLILRLLHSPHAAAVSLPGSLIVLAAPVWLLWIAWTLAHQPD